MADRAIPGDLRSSKLGHHRSGRDWTGMVLGHGPNRGDKVLAYLFLLPAAILLGILVLYPFSQVIFLGFYEKDTLLPDKTWVGLDNYYAFFQYPDLANAFKNTIYWTAGSVIMEMCVGMVTALVLHQNLRFRTFARGVVLFPYLLPTIVAVLVWKFMLSSQVGIISSTVRQLGISDAPLSILSRPETAMIGVILVGTWKFFPFVVIAMLGILQSVPSDRYEAAKCDGAGWWQEFRYITIPAILPVIMLTALLRTIWTWDKFDIIYQLTGGGPIQATTTMSIYVYYEMFQQFNQGRAAAVAMVMFLIMLTMALAYTALYDRAERAQS
ncbi:MAG: carbohydrate ABC transporter permease [Chloroflexota bacterium]